MPPLKPAPFRQTGKTFVTPRIEDILLTETVDVSRSDIPEYGTPHPDRKRFPNHKLVFVIEDEETEREDVYKFYYARDRDEQDQYNFSFGFKDIAGRSFRAFQRTYVTLRSDFDPESPTFGDEPDDVPEDQLFEDTTYIFYEKEMQRINEKEIDSLYVIEVQTFIERSLLDHFLSIRQEKATQDLIPERFRSSLPTVVRETVEEGLVSDEALDTDTISRVEEQLTTDVKRVTTVTRPVPEAGVAINGSIAYVENATVADVTETFTKDETPPEADQGLHIVESVVTPLGDNNYIKKTVEVDEWPLLRGSEWSNELNAQITRTEQFVEPPTDFTEPNTSFRPINKDRSLKIVEEIPTEALLSYRNAFPFPYTLDLPNILRSASVVWSTDVSNGKFRSDWEGLATGTSYGLSGSEGGDASSSASVRPDIVADIENPWGSDIMMTSYAFYAEAPNNVLDEGMFLARLSEVVGQPVNRWPTFRPVSHTIITQGAKVGVTARAQGAASVSYSQSAVSWDKSQGTGDSYDYGISVGTFVLPPTLHGLIVLTNTPTQAVAAYATAEAHWVGYNFPDIHAVASAAKSASGYVQPSALAPTNPPDIPRSGYYVVKSQVEPYRYGWVKCFAIVFDASIFA